MYYREAAGAFVVFDVCERSTLELAARWKESLDQNLSDDEYRLPVILVGNKCDLDHEPLKETLDAFVKEHGFVSWIETSAKKNIGIEEAVMKLVDEIMKNESLEPAAPRPDIIHPEQPAPPAPQQSNCPCA